MVLSFISRDKLWRHETQALPKEPCSGKSAGFPPRLRRYSTPRMAMPTITSAITAYWALVSFSFKNSRAHRAEKML